MDSARKILILISSDKHTGPGRVALIHAQLISNTGITVHFCSRKNGTLEERARSFGLWREHSLSLPTRGEPWAVAADIFALKEMFVQEKYDMVLTYRSAEHFSTAVALGGCVALLRFVHDAGKYGKCNPLVTWSFKKMAASQRTTGLLAPNMASSELLVNMTGRIAGEVETVNGCVDTEEFSPDASGDVLRRELGFAKNDFVVGLVARMKWGRGHYGFAHALKIASELEPRVKALLIGDGEEREKIMDVAASIGIGDRVCCIKPEARYIEALAAVDIGFIWSPGSAGTAQAALEMMSMGKPVVAPHAPAFRDFSPAAIMVNDGLEAEFNPGDDFEEDGVFQKNLAGTIARLCREHGFYDNSCAASRRIVNDKFSLRAATSKLSSIIDRYTRNV